MHYYKPNTPNLPQDPGDASGALLFFGGLALAIFFIWSIAAVFGALFVAGGIIVVTIVIIVILGAAIYRKQQRFSLQLVLLGLSALWLILGGFIVFKIHWLAFTPTAWIFNCLFIAALVSGVWSVINTWLKVISSFLAVSLVLATIVIPRPAGGEGPLDTAEKWYINIDVKDENLKPLQGAFVLCGAIMKWKTTIEISETFARQTDRDGSILTWEFNEDPRLKIVICNAWKNADDGNAGYPPVSQFIFSPTGGEYELQFTLVENPHPDTAYLTFDLNGDYEQMWYTLQFELWANKPSGYFGARDGAQLLQTKDGHNEFRNIAFTVNATQAAHDMYLRYFYEGPSEGLGPPYSELRTIHVGFVKLGTRKRLMLQIPRRNRH